MSLTNKYSELVIIVIVITNKSCTIAYELCNFSYFVYLDSGDVS